MENNNVAIKSYDYDKSIANMDEKELKKLTTIAKSIRENDINSIQTYGSDLSQIVRKNGDDLLRITKSNSETTEDACNIINNLLVGLNDIDLDKLNEENSFIKFIRQIPLIKKLVKKYKTNLVKFNNIADNVDDVAKKITATKLIALKDNGTLQIIFDNNVSYVKRMRELIIAAMLKEKELGNTIATMESNPDTEPYMLQDMYAFREALQKRITDMKVTEYIMGQDLLQIRALQNSNNMIAQKSDNIVNTVIPIWKNQLSISVTMQNQRNNIEVQRMASDATNEILVRNAELLKMNTINVAKANEESVVSADTLRKTTQSLIDTMNEYKRIHDEGERKRNEINETLKELSEKLSNELNNQ